MEYLLEAQDRPVDSAAALGETDIASFTSTTEPGEELFFVAANEYGIAADAQNGSNRLLLLQLPTKPVRPIGHGRQAV